MRGDLGKHTIREKQFNDFLRFFKRWKRGIWRLRRMPGVAPARCRVAPSHSGASETRDRPTVSPHRLTVSSHLIVSPHPGISSHRLISLSHLISSSRLTPASHPISPSHLIPSAHLISPHCSPHRLTISSHRPISSHITSSPPLTHSSK